MEAYFKKFVQIGILVNDLDEAIRNFKEKFGIGPWKKQSLNPALFPGMTVDGKPSDLKNECAFCEAYGMEWELIQPISDSPYKEWLDKHGPGIQHLSLIPRESFDDTLDDVKQTTGKELWLRGRCPEVGMDFAYLDLKNELGFLLEIHNEDRSAMPGHEF